MEFSINFKNLPFSPLRKQIIFVENGYDRDVNEFIRYNYDWCRNYCRNHGFEFVYIPLLTSNAEVTEQVQYYAPYLQTNITEHDLPKSDMLMEYICNPEDYHRVVPSLMVYGYSNKGVKTFHFWHFPGNCEDYLGWFLLTVRHIEQEYRSGELNRNPYSRLRSKKSSCPVSCESPAVSVVPGKLLSARDPKQEQIVVHEDAQTLGAEYVQNDAVDDITSSVEHDIKQLKKTVKRLRMKGLTLSAIQEIVVQQEKVSRIDVSGL